jgi:lysophospholipase L1-like esterase
MRRGSLNWSGASATAGKKKFTRYNFTMVKIRNWVVWGVVLSCPLIFTNFAMGQGTAFSYQGRLTDSGGAANGSYDLQFAIYDASTNGNQIGATLTNNGVAVSNGLFFTDLDFGGLFSGNNYWLQISARTNGGASFTALNPRQQITPVPYSIMANSASNLLGTLPAGQLSGALATTQLPASVVINGATGLNLAGTFSGDGGGMTNIYSANLLNDQSVVSISRSLSAPSPSTNWAFYPMDYTASNFLVCGGLISPIQDGAYAECWDMAYMQTGASGPFQQASAMSAAFGIDGNQVVIAISGGGHDWSVVVNGVDNYLTNTVPNDGNLYFYTITFATSATRTILLNNAWPFYGVYVPVTNGFFEGGPAKKRRMVLMGDSFVEQEYGPFARCEGISTQLQLLFPQLDIWALGEGGTGFVNPGTPGRTNFLGRVNDIISAQPNYVVVYGGINDTGFATNAGIQEIFANTTNLISTVKAELPSAQMMIIGPQWPRSPDGYFNVLACATALSNACVVEGIPYVCPITEPWITGVVTIPNSGNADIYTSPSDGTHPTIPAGATFLANKIASAISQTWNLGAPTSGPAVGSIALLTNGIPTPVAGLGILWNSNNALYWVTTSHTNYICGP